MMYALLPATCLDGLFGSGRTFLQGHDSRLAPLPEQRRAVLAKVAAVTHAWIGNVFAEQSMPLNEIVIRGVHAIYAAKVEAFCIRRPIVRTRRELCLIRRECV